MALAKWYKVDFHTHTPESRCFQDRNVTPRQWLAAAKDKGSSQNLKMKVLRYVMELNFVFHPILHIFLLFLMIKCL